MFARVYPFVELSPTLKGSKFLRATASDVSLFSPSCEYELAIEAKTF
jgi:hypothetical protein